MTPVQWYCPNCGPVTRVGEDYGCAMCGADTFHSEVPWFVSAIRAAVEEETERCAKVAEECSRGELWWLATSEAHKRIAAAIRRKP